MPKEPLSFADGIQRIVSDLAQMDLAPDADHALIQQLRDTVISYQQTANAQAASAGPGLGPDYGRNDLSAPSLGGMEMPVMEPVAAEVPLPLPVVDGEQSRGPNPNPDMSGAVEELRRVMNGA